MLLVKETMFLKRRKANDPKGEGGEGYKDDGPNINSSINREHSILQESI